jgi:hypothetical protein
MADKFYSIVARGQGKERKAHNIVVGTTSTGANPIELRITTGAMSRSDVYAFLEWMSDLVVSLEANQVIAAGTLIL